MFLEVISGDVAMASLAREWKQLYLETTRFPFGDPGAFMAWWQFRGKPAGYRLCVVAGWRNGKLVAIAPLVLSRRLGLRILEWGGSDVFDYCDTLVADVTLVDPVWDFIRRCCDFDFGILRDVHTRASCRPTLELFSTPVRGSRAAQLWLHWPSGEAWLASGVSASTRAYFRRTARRLEQQGPINFHVCREKPVPAHILGTLLRQKAEWAKAQGRQSWLTDKATGAGALLYELAGHAADTGTLHLSWLACGDTIIATHLGLQQHGTLCWYIPSYEMAWGRFAPGRFLLLKLIVWAIDHGQWRVDFMRGEEQYKSQLANAYEDLRDYVFSNSPIARMVEPWVIPLCQLRHVGGLFQASHSGPISAEA